MRPRDSHGKGYDLSTQHRAVEQQPSGNDQPKAIPGLTDTRDIADRWLSDESQSNTLEQPPPSHVTARITVRSGFSTSELSGEAGVDEPAKLQLHRRMEGAFHASKDEKGQQQTSGGLAAGEEVVDNPGDADMGVDAMPQNSLQGMAAVYAANTLQAKAKAATQGENIVDVETARVMGSGNIRVASENSMTIAKLAADAGALKQPCTSPPEAL
jgi:hypothetical protein